MPQQLTASVGDCNFIFQVKTTSAETADTQHESTRPESAKTSTAEAQPAAAVGVSCCNGGTMLNYWRYKFLILSHDREKPDVRPLIYLFVTRLMTIFQGLTKETVMKCIALYNAANPDLQGASNTTIYSNAQSILRQ